MGTGTGQVDQQSEQVIENGVTLGKSQKAILAFFYPLIVALVVTVINWAATGTFDANEIRISVSGLALSTLAGLGAIVGRPGPVQGQVKPALARRSQL